ncbi:SMI1/KNR4 family protein [Streptomyces sp. NPDC002870]|uniref:SMI1/KNR4 family protein n=1 Tax=Streptomyces sp. NPDC002870 TaxID=3364666 RepID=UPI0036AC096B
MSEVAEVLSAWNRIVRWLEANAPVSAQALKPPATNEDIDRLNEYLGFEIPDVLDAWLRMNNGSTAKDSTAPISGGGMALISHAGSLIFPDGEVFLGCEEIMRRHAEYLQIASSIDDEDYWKRSWIPVVEKSDAPYGFLLDAERRGESAPVLRFGEGDYPEVCLPSLSGLLCPIADVLEHGEAAGSLMAYRRATVTDGRIEWAG